MPLCLNEVLVKKLGYTLLKPMTILATELWWTALKTRSSLGFLLATDPTLTKMGPWLQIHFERPQLFHVNTAMVVQQGFGVLWWWR